VEYVDDSVGIFLYRNWKSKDSVLVEAISAVIQDFPAVGRRNVNV
jgi:hypothetical protein